MSFMLPKSEIDPVEFQAPLLRLQETAPSPLGRKVLWGLLLFLAALLLWALLGRLDIVAVAEGKLVPESYLKIVQPAEAGIVKEILVREGESVQAGQVLMRMDALFSDADVRLIEAEHQRKRLSLRRIEAELSGAEFKIEENDPVGLGDEIAAQFRANRSALAAALAEERSRMVKAGQEMAAAEQVRRRLEESLPYYREQDKAYEKLVKDGFAGSLMGSDKRRERQEKEQELQTQRFVIESARASISQSEKRLAQITADYQRQLHAERNEIQSEFDQLTQELAKQTHRRQLLELKAAQDGVVKDLATHSSGTVVQPGTVLLSLVPKGEILRAQVWVSNADIGFVREGLPVKLKFAAFPFQKYGMVKGRVLHVSADAADIEAQGERLGNGSRLVYKALIALERMALEMDGQRFDLSAGMQANAEIWLGDRTVMEYLLSPVRKAWHEAGRER